MPYVNIKYQLTLDATVILAHLEFHGEAVTPENTTGEDNFPDIKVFVDGSLSVSLLLAGFGEWQIEVWVIELEDDTDMQTGGWIPLKPNKTSTFRGDASEQNHIQDDYLILWP